MRPFSWLSLFLIAIYFVYGAYVPFWSLWLESKGISAEQIGLLIGLGLGIRFAGNLLIMGRANRASLLIPTCRYLAVLSLLCYLGFYWVDSFWALLALMLLANFIYPTLLPLSEALAARMMLQVKLDYGKVRLWGSAAFIVGSTLVGALVQHYGASWVLHAMILGLLLLTGLSWLPMAPAPQDAPSSGNKIGFRSLLTDRSFLIFLLVVSLLQGSHAAYYGFSALYWKAHGYAENVIGYLWALGVMAEIGMFALSRRLLKGFSYQQLFFIGGLGCVLRWTLLANTTELAWLLVAQLLHAVTFCVSHLGAIRYMTQQLPAEQVIPAQTLYAAFPAGVVMALLTAVAGFGYQQVQGQVFWLMAMLVVPVFFIRVPKRVIVPG
ncbi:MAG: 3-phenylpropionate MFS transporter [Aeromonadaceae bacterium]|nr:3-phenylpropionate MFS transporter [Aeromonadaceae bacterium]